MNWKHRLRDVCFAESAGASVQGLRSQFGVPKTGSTIRSVLAIKFISGDRFLGPELVTFLGPIWACLFFYDSTMVVSAR